MVRAMAIKILIGDFGGSFRNVVHFVTDHVRPNQWILQPQQRKNLKFAIQFGIKFGRETSISVAVQAQFYKLEK